MSERVTIEGTDVPMVSPGLIDDYDTANAAWRFPAETLNEMAAELEDINEVWYAAATRVFAEGTAEGDLIRGQIPTTYDPANPPLPAPGTPLGLSVVPGPDPGKAEAVWVATPYAAYYQFELRNNNGDLLPAPEQVSTNALHLTGLISGQQYTFAVRAGNITGQSPASAALSFTAG